MTFYWGFDASFWFKGLETKTAGPYFALLGLLFAMAYANEELRGRVDSILRSRSALSPGHDLR